jgi:hypothetical protein
MGRSMLRPYKGEPKTQTRNQENTNRGKSEPKKKRAQKKASPKKSEPKKKRAQEKASPRKSEPKKKRAQEKANPRPTRKTGVWGTQTQEHSPFEAQGKQE